MSCQKHVSGQEIELYIPKSVGASTQSCLKPFFMGNGSDKFPLNETVPFISLWKDSIMLASFGGNSTLGKILNRPSKLTRSNALVRSIKDI